MDNPPEVNQPEHTEVATFAFTEEQFVSTLEQLNGMVGDSKEINTLNMMQVTLGLMQLVETYPNLRGRDKQKLVMRAIEVFIDKHGGDKAILNFLPTVITSCIQLDRGELTIRITPESATNCCLSLVTALNSSKRTKKK